MDADQTLIARTLRGNLSAFEQLVQRHGDVVFRVAARIVGPVGAEDVSQDAFLRAYHRSDRSEPPPHLEAGGCRSPRTPHRTRCRASNSRASAPPESDSLPDPDSRRQPASALEERERQQRLEVKLQLLRPDYRSLLVLRDLEELPLRRNRPDPRRTHRNRQGDDCTAPWS